MGCPARRFSSRALGQSHCQGRCARDARSAKTGARSPAKQVHASPRVPHLLKHPYAGAGGRGPQPGAEERRPTLGSLRRGHLLHVRRPGKVREPDGIEEALVLRRREQVAHIGRAEEHARAAAWRPRPRWAQAGREGRPRPAAGRRGHKRRGFTAPARKRRRKAARDGRQRQRRGDDHRRPQPRHRIPEVAHEHCGNVHSPRSWATLNAPCGAPLTWAAGACGRRHSARSNGQV